MHKRSLSLTLGNGRVVPIEVATARKNGDWYVCAQATIDGTPVRFAATASETLVRQALAKLGKIPATSTSGVFDDIGRNIARFARSRALTSVLQSIATVANNPLVRKLAGAYPMLGSALEYVGKGANAAAAAQSLIVRTKNGDAKANAAIAAITQGARKGNPSAQMMHKILGTVFQNMRGEGLAPPISAGAALDRSDPDLLALARTVRATG